MRPLHHSKTDGVHADGRLERQRRKAKTHDAEGYLADALPLVQPLESAYEQSLCAAELLWPHGEPGEDAAFPQPDGDVLTPARPSTSGPGVASVRSSLRPLPSTSEALEPRVSPLRQLWNLARKHRAANLALLLATVLGLLPITSYAQAQYMATWQARASALITLWCMALIAVHGVPAGPCLFAGTLSLAALGIITSKDAFSGLGDPVVILVGALNILARAFENSGILEQLVVPLLGAPRSAVAAQLRLMVVVCAASGLLNHTAVVAMMIPVVKGWGVKIGVPAAKLMIPLAFASVLGGSTTLIGSGSNLAAASWAAKQGLPPLNFFALTPIGAALCGIGILYFAVLGNHLLPGAKAEPEMAPSLAEPILRSYRYTVVFHVLGPGPFNAAIGRSPRDLGLLSLAGTALAAGSRHLADSPLQAGDALYFQASASGFAAIRRVQGLAPAVWATTVAGLGTRRSHRRLYEAVLAPSSPLVGAPMDLPRFTKVFRAVPLAVHRPGAADVWAEEESFHGFVPEAQDIFLLEAFLPGPAAGSSDFLLVGEVPDSAPPRCFTKADLWRQRFCLLGLVALVSATATGHDAALAAALLAISLLVVKAVTLAEAYRFLNGPLLLTIAASFGLAAAIENSHLADELATVVMGLVQPLGRPGVVVGVYVCGALMGQVLSNVASALILLPTTVALSKASGIPQSDFVLLVVYAVNANFTTPMSSLGNLMVLPHGGYGFLDYVRLGVPLLLLHLVGTCSMCMWLASGAAPAPPITALNSTVLNVSVPPTQG